MYISGSAAGAAAAVPLRDGNVAADGRGDAGAAADGDADAVADDAGQPRGRGRPETPVDVVAETHLVKFAAADSGSLFFGDRAQTCLRSITRYSGSNIYNIFPGDIASCSRRCLGVD